jgi:hypothetical protein
MRVSPWFLFATILSCLPAVRAAHAEKKVYKCINANGSMVFSPDPCDASAQALKVDAGSAPVAPPAASATSPPTPAAPAANALDAKCRDEARRLRVYPGEVNLQALLQQQAGLVRAYATEQTAPEAMKVRIGNLDVAIAAEQERIAQARSSVDRSYRDAIAKCDARRAESERRAEAARQTEQREPKPKSDGGP